MAETLPYGPVVPNRTDRISKSGVDEIRTLGASVSGALGAASSFTSTVDSAARARDDVLAADIAGMEGMTYVGAWVSGTVYRINDVVTHGGDSWARLTAGSAGEPGVSATDWGLVARKGDGGGFGDLNETEVVGLYDTVEGSMTQDQVVGLTAALAAKRDIAPMVIAEGTNLNDVKTPGEHSQQFTSWATPELNYPGGASPVAGRLFVAGNVARTQVTQFYVPFTTSTLDVWVRNFYVSWGSWSRLATSSDPGLYESGARNVASTLTADWTAAARGVRLSRNGNIVTLAVDVTSGAESSSARDLLPIPLGFRPAINAYLGQWRFGAVTGWLDMNSNSVRVRDFSAALAAGGRITTMLMWPTNDAIPSTLPGTPA